MSIGRTPTLIICLAAAGVAVVALALPGSDDPDPAPGAGGDTASPAVEIVDFAFSGTDTVEPAATIAVTNSDSTAHTLTAADATFDTGVLDAAASGTITVPQDAGTYEYFCSIHPSMTGTLTVLE